MASELGQGWKVQPCRTLEPKSVTTIADISGPGIVQHIWITADAKILRDCVLRIFWDDETEPSVESFLGEFFALGFGQRYAVNSMVIAVNSTGGMNSYWQMPFRKRCRITVENLLDTKSTGFFYQITYSLCPVPEDAAYFHAQWRRSVSDINNPDIVLLDGVKGKGHYVGTFLAWSQMCTGWWGEGEVKFFMDGDTQFPTICGTGTEDYFGGAWCFGETYSTPFLGYPYWRRETGTPPAHALYRWHVLDPIRFKKDLRVTVQTLTAKQAKYHALSEDVASVCYWYQAEPHNKFPKLDEGRLKWAR